MHLMWYQISHSWLLVSLGLYFVIMGTILSSGIFILSPSIPLAYVICMVLWTIYIIIELKFVAKVCKVRYGVGHAFMLLWLQSLLGLHTIISGQTIMVLCGTGYRWVPPMEVEFSHSHYCSTIQVLTIPSFPSLYWFLNFCLFLEMTVAFTSLMAILIIERIDAKKGTISILPLVLAGIISSVYWRQANPSCLLLGTEFFSLSYGI